jgi:hypothetical protein
MFLKPWLPPHRNSYGISRHILALRTPCAPGPGQGEYLPVDDETRFGWHSENAAATRPGLTREPKHLSLSTSPFFGMQVLHVVA